MNRSILIKGAFAQYSDVSKVMLRDGAQYKPALWPAQSDSRRRSLAHVSPLSAWCQKLQATHYGDDLTAPVMLTLLMDDITL